MDASPLLYPEEAELLKFLVASTEEPIEAAANTAGRIFQLTRNTVAESTGIRLGHLFIEPVFNLSYFLRKTISRIEVVEAAGENPTDDTWANLLAVERNIGILRGKTMVMWNLEREEYVSAYMREVEVWLRKLDRELTHEPALMSEIDAWASEYFAHMKKAETFANEAFFTFSRRAGWMLMGYVREQYEARQALKQAG